MKVLISKAACLRCFFLRCSLREIQFLDFPEVHYMQLSVQLASELKGTKPQCTVNLLKKCLLKGALGLCEYKSEFLLLMANKFIYKHEFQNLVMKH